ncbi:MAG: GTPase ObgE [Prochlorococcus sp. SP3034]|nr:GTPase ObgE [Prochlorococcus sp. SP3034]
MHFIDQAKVIVIAGKGGDGIVSFRREKFVPAGGPSGGNGGKGGSVIFEADNNLQTLLDFKFNREIVAKDGLKGGPNKRSGASGEDKIVKVPCGTEIRDINTGIILGDLLKNKEKVVIARGGRGGLGNSHFLSNQNRAPEFCIAGREGEIWEIKLELKLIAEVGIIGLPNAGKSTLISVISSASPKIANYPFTTLIPNLGVVRKSDGNGCLFADIPGLISGAAEGIGLGHDFLRHVERTKILVHLIETSSEHPIEDYKVIEEELNKYGHGLIKKERIIVLSKMELVKEDYLKIITKKLENLSKKKVFVISSSLRKGLSQLLSEVWEKV